MPLPAACRTQALTDSCPDAKKECCEITKKVLSANRPMGCRKFPHKMLREFKFDITKNGKAQLNDQKSFGSTDIVGNHPIIAKKTVPCRDGPWKLLVVGPVILG